MSPELTLDTAQTLDKLQSLAGAAAAHRQVGDAHFLVLPKDFAQTEITAAVRNLLPRPARLKYRLGSGNVKFWYELDRPENATDEASVEYVSRVRDAGYAVLIGKA